VEREEKMKTLFVVMLLGSLFLGRVSYADSITVFNTANGAGLYLATFSLMHNALGAPRSVSHFFAFVTSQAISLSFVMGQGPASPNQFYRGAAAGLVGGAASAITIEIFKF
jgi:hypothetical protein